LCGRHPTNLIQGTKLIMTSSISRIRNIGIMAHVDAGKTTTTERILFYTGRNHRLGEVHDGNATMDWMKQEQERGITITSAATSCDWDGHTINLIDTPGHVDFQVEVQRSLRVLDGAVGLFDSVAGVEPQSEAVWRMADQFGVPRLAYVNKMDRVGADYQAAIATMRDRLNANALAIQLPIGSEGELAGIIDLVAMRAILYRSDDGRDFDITDIPQQHQPAAQAAREELLDALSHHDDQLLEALIDDQPVDAALIAGALRRATLAMAVCPVLCGSSLRNKGVQPLLDAIVAYLPSPMDRGAVVSADGEQTLTPDPEGPLVALAFKVQRDPQAGKLTYVRVYSGTLRAGQPALNARTGSKERVGQLWLMHAQTRQAIPQAGPGSICAIVGAKRIVTADTLCDPAHPITLETISFPDPVVHVAIEPATRHDQDRLGDALRWMLEEDPSLQLSSDEQTGQTVISGMGELHLEVLVSRLGEEHGVSVRVGRPQVAYQETARRAAATAVGRVKSQTGGSGQFAHIVIDLEPHPGGGVVFANAVRGGAVPADLARAAEKGIRDALAAGLRGWPVTDVKVTLTDGETHPVDSNEMAFRAAGRLAAQAAMQRADMTLLEPVMAVTVSCRGDQVGAVIGELSRRRGQVTSQQINPDGQATVAGLVPLATMFGFAGDLRGVTQGHGQFSMTLDGYEQAPELDQRLHHRVAA